jgi:hypothetical protein
MCLIGVTWRAHRVRLKEVAPKYIVDDVLARIEAVLFD